MIVWLFFFSSGITSASSVRYPFLKGVDQISRTLHRGPFWRATTATMKLYRAPATPTAAKTMDNNIWGEAKGHDQVSCPLQHHILKPLPVLLLPPPPSSSSPSASPSTHCLITIFQNFKFKLECVSTERTWDEMLEPEPSILQTNFSWPKNIHH